MERKFLIFGLRKLGLRWRKKRGELALVQSIVLVQAKRRNNDMKFIYGNYHKPYVFMGC